MSGEKLLTISIAAYNVERYLDKALETLAAVKNRDCLDVIVVNDGSKDETSELAHSYERQHPGFIRVLDKRNAGYGSTINASLRVARGAYFKLLDGDDWVKPAELDKMLDGLSATDSDVVVTPYDIVQEGTGNVTPVRVKGDYDGKSHRLLDFMTGQAFPMHALAFRTEMLVKNGVSITERCYYTDYEYTVKPLLYAETISFIDADVYQYRIGREGQSVSLASMKKNVDMAITTSLNLASFYEEKVAVSEIADSKRYLLLEQVAASTRNKYRIILLLDSLKEGKQKFWDYDARLKVTSHAVYEETIEASSRMKAIMRLLSIGKGLFYPAVSAAVKAQSRREGR